MKIALKLPGFPSPIPTPEGLNQDIKDLGSLLSQFFNIAFYAAIFLAFFFLVWAAFAYMLASGQKENLAKARARITWALIGLAVTLLAFFIAKFVSEILKPKGVLPF